MATRHGSILSSQDVSGLGYFEFNSSALLVCGAGGQFVSNTPFDGDILGVPTATSVVYDGATNELALEMERGMVLHNSTKGERVFIEATNTATNTITVEADSPDNAGTWDNNDVITCQSTVGVDAGYIDIDVTPVVSTTNGTPIAISLIVNTALRNADAFSCELAPYEAWDANKSQSVTWSGAVPTLARSHLIVPLASADDRYYFIMRVWNLTADNGHISAKMVGQFTAL